MAQKETDLRIRISQDDKQIATNTLNAMGLTVSQAVRLFLDDVASNGRLPFEIKVPNQTTRDAMEEAERLNESQQGHETVRSLMDDLNAD